MLVRIRLDRGVPFEQRRGKNRHLALAAAGLLVPVSLMAVTLACWRLAADMQLAARFAIASGPFSHWQVWMGVGVGGALAAYRLNRYGRGR